MRVFRWLTPKGPCSPIPRKTPRRRTNAPPDLPRKELIVPALAVPAGGSADEGEGEFVTSAMEDTGTLQSLTYLDAIGRVDVDRVMVLRSGSNFTMPPPSFTAAEYLLRENEEYAGLEVALEALYLAGSKVVDEIVANWDVYADDMPSAE